MKNNEVLTVLALLVATVHEGYSSPVLDCLSGYVACHDGSKCIPASWWCDNIIDCQDQSDISHCDESNTTTTGSTPTTTNSTTTRTTQQTTTEATDPPVTVPPTTSSGCLVGEKYCHGLCLPSRYICDGKFDCGDKEDEKDCACAADEFRCDIYLCKSNKRKCDGFFDCKDKTDELNCECGANYTRCDSGYCMRTAYFCDGDNDCFDWSDEKKCECGSDTRACKIGYPCIPLVRWCDGFPDCPDDSDEKYGCTCLLSDMHQCDGHCVGSAQLGDDRVDCSDWSDEYKAGSSCPNDTMECANHRCVPLSRRCDENNDCGDMTDESNCVCNQMQFHCRNGVCISRDNVCNNIDDCGDQSDEVNCECNEEEWRCRNGKCILKAWLCDGNPDCPEGEDERDCGSCGHNQYRCRRYQCVPIAKRCDGVYDCDDGSDEQLCLLSHTLRRGLYIVMVETARFPKTISSGNWKPNFSRTACNKLGYGNDIITFFINKDVRPCVLLSGEATSENLLKNKTEGTCKKVVAVACEEKGCGKKLMADPVSSIMPLIVGGKIAEPGGSPWSAIIHMRFDGSTFTCAGVVIDPRWVLTSSACLRLTKFRPDGFVYPRNIYVWLGTTFASGITPSARLIRVKKVFPHEGFVHTVTVANNLAMLQLVKPVELSHKIQPICLPPPGWNLKHSLECYITGWGYRMPKRWSLSNELRQAKMTLLEKEDCVFNNTVVGQEYSPDDTMFCAGYKTGIIHPCTGDGAAPLSCRDENGYWVLSGIATQVFCEQGPARFTRISSYVEWIKGIMDKN